MAYVRYLGQQKKDGIVFIPGTKSEARHERKQDDCTQGPSTSRQAVFLVARGWTADRFSFIIARGWHVRLSDLYVRTWYYVLLTIISIVSRC